MFVKYLDCKRRLYLLLHAHFVNRKTKHCIIRPSSVRIRERNNVWDETLLFSSARPDMNVKLAVIIFLIIFRTLSVVARGRVARCTVNGRCWRTDLIPTKWIIIDDKHDCYVPTYFNNGILWFVKRKINI